MFEGDINIFMCGIFYNSITPKNIQFDELKNRGPDYEQSLENDLGYFYHSNLSTKQNSSKQPLAVASGVLLYNGTQYEMLKDDTSYIANNLSADVSHNIEFINSLLGDFSIIWVTEEHILVARDFGGNKPLFYGCSTTQFCASSSMLAISEQDLTPVEIEPNTIMVFNRNTRELLLTHNAKLFNLSQTVNSFDNVFQAFTTSVLNRFQENSIVPLSGGIDSGAMAACLNNHNKSFFISTRVGAEDKSILDDRYKILKSCPKYIFNDVSIDTLKSTATYQFGLSKDYKILRIQNYRFMQPMQVAWEIASHAKAQGYKYVLSGSGADEIYSDYGWNGTRYRPYSYIGGLFPTDLSTVWPWFHRRELPLRFCIFIEDFTYGQFGMDTRSPYLDVQLVQHWLNLTTELKNKEYKYWQQQYLRDLNFPYTVEKTCLPIKSNIRKQVFLENEQHKFMFN